MIYGTYPAAVKDFEGAIDTLSDYVDGILFKDVFKLADIRRNSRFVDLVSLLAYRIGSEVSLESLGNELKKGKKIYFTDLAGILHEWTNLRQMVTLYDFVFQPLILEKSLYKQT